MEDVGATINDGDDTDDDGLRGRKVKRRREVLLVTFPMLVKQGMTAGVTKAEGGSRRFRNIVFKARVLCRVVAD